MIARLNKAFESRVRLGIMSALVVNDSLEFKALRDLLAVTDGNLASHIKALDKTGYVKSKKSFVDRKPNTKYMVTAAGNKAFKAHIEALEDLIRGS